VAAPRTPRAPRVDGIELVVERGLKGQHALLILLVNAPGLRDRPDIGQRNRLLAGAAGLAQRGQQQPDEQRDHRDDYEQFDERKRVSARREKYPRHGTDSWMGQIERIEQSRTDPRPDG
jgi:DNA-binding IclR family transcriptional regulator